MEEDGEGAENKGDNVKVALLGSSGVGKTCIIKRYTEDSFDENSVTTAGASYSQKILNVEGKSIQLDLWDTAGQEKYRSLGRRFYKDAYIICLVYDITNATTFEELKNNWFKDLKEFGEKYNVVAVVGTKSDLYEKEEVKEDDARKYAESIEAIFMLTSAKNGNNINLLFETLVRQYLGPEFSKKVKEMKEVKGDVSKIVSPKKNKKNKKKKFC